MPGHARVVVCTFVLVTALAAHGLAESPISSRLKQAADLYEAAAYQEALAVLDPLDPSQSEGVAEAQTLRRYRALCLIALDRAVDAARVAEDMVRADPNMAVNDSLPPRLRTTLQEVRPRIARQLVREGYDGAKALYARADYTTAAREFERVIRLLDDPSLGLSADPALADVKTLADGFLTLAREAGKKTPPAATVTAPGAPPAVPAAAAPPPAVPAVTAAPPATAGPSQRVADAGTDIVPPRPITQKVPPVPPGVLAGYMPRREGEIEVSVAADGSVESARITMSIHPAYDTILLEAAKSWRYEPATRAGVPVAVKKRVRVQVQIP
jgi:protein TonB